MILSGILQLLKQVDSSRDITVMAAPNTHYQDVKTISFFPAGLRSLVKEFRGGSSRLDVIKRADWVIFGGGGLFAENSFKANLIWAIQAFPLLLFKKKFIFLGQSLPEVKNSIFKSYIKHLLKEAKLCVFRDQSSTEIAINYYSAAPEKVLTKPDLAFAYQVTPPQFEENKISIAPRFRKEKLQDQIDCYTELLTLLQDKYKIEFLRFQAAGEEDDQKLIQHLERFGRTITPTPALDQVAGRLLIAERLHSAISAIKLEKPFVALSYNPKVENFLTTAGFKDLVLPHNSTPAEIYEKIQYIEANYDEIRERLKSYNQTSLVDLADLKSTLQKYFTIGV